MYPLFAIVFERTDTGSRFTVSPVLLVKNYCNFFLSAKSMMNWERAKNEIVPVEDEKSIVSKEDSSDALICVYKLQILSWAIICNKKSFFPDTSEMNSLVLAPIQNFILGQTKLYIPGGF